MTAPSRTLASAITLSTLRTAVRRGLSDTSTVTQNQTFPDADINQQINYALRQIQARANSQDPSTGVVREDVAYTGGATGQALPATVQHQRILSVHEVSDPAFPVELQPVSIYELDLYHQTDTDTDRTGSSAPAYRYGIIATTTDARQIAVRPLPSAALTLRISYAIAGLYLAADADTFPLSADEEELCVMAAIVRLRGRFGANTPEQLAILQQLWGDFLVRSERMAGGQRVRRTRRAM